MGWGLPYKAYSFFSSYEEKIFVVLRERLSLGNLLGDIEQKEVEQILGLSCEKGG